MFKKEIEQCDVSEAVQAILNELGHQRARVFVFYTDAHRKLAKTHAKFEHAMTQADRVFSADPLVGEPFVGQKEFLDSLAILMGGRKAKIAILAGPVKDARDLAKKMELSHPGFTSLAAIDLPPNYDQDETITGHVIEAINKVGAEIVLLASMLRNQEVWLSNYRHRFNCSVIIGLH